MLTFTAKTVNGNKFKGKSDQADDSLVPRSMRKANDLDPNGTPVHCHDELAWDEENSL